MARAIKRDRWQRVSFLAATMNNLQSPKKKRPEELNPMALEDEAERKASQSTGDRIREVHEALKSGNP